MYRPPQVTEREPDGTWEDCSWAAAVMFANAAEGRAAHPSTQAEYEALRRASGDTMTGGSTLFDVRDGMQRRYGWSVEPDADAFATFWASFTPGTGAIVQGSMGAVSDHLRRWDPPFRGSHASYAQREDDRDRAWWMNPLAPKSYQGEWISKTMLRAFYMAQPGARTITVGIGSRGDAMAAIPVGNHAAYTVALTVGDMLYDEALKSLAKVVKAQTVPGLFYTGTGYIAISYGPSAGLAKRLLFVRTADVTVSPVAVTTPGADCTAVQHELDTANQRIVSAVTALGGTI